MGFGFNYVRTETTEIQTVVVGHVGGLVLDLPDADAQQHGVDDDRHGQRGRHAYPRQVHDERDHEELREGGGRGEK